MQNYNTAFDRAADELEDLVKSRRSRGESTREMSDAKDYMEEDIDSFDRRAEGQRRADMRASSREWRGIQALDDDELFALGDELSEESRAMLVSGRPSRIRFPGAKGDSTLKPFDRERYVADEDDDLDEGFAEGRSAVRQRNQRLRASLGGDSLSWRSQASRRGVGEDDYGTGKSFGVRGRNLLDPRCLIKGSREFDLLKSRVMRAVCDEQADPELGMILDSYDPFHMSTRYNVVRCISSIPREVRRRYGIPDAPPAVEAALGGVRGSGQGMGSGLSY